MTEQKHNGGAAERSAGETGVNRCADAKSLRILHLLNDVENFGNGIVYSTLELALEQAAMGHSVAVGSAGGVYEGQLEEAGVRHFRVPQRSGHALPLNLLKLRACLRDFRPDVLHCHMVAGVVLATFLRPTLPRPRPLVIAHARNSWMAHSRLMRTADHAIALSNGSRERLLAMGFQADRMSVVRNGTLGSRLGRFDKSDAGGAERLSAPSVVSVCGLYSRKGIFDLLEAARLCVERAPEVTFYVVGEGPERSALEHAIERAGLSGKFELLGFRPEVGPILEQATVFVLASRDEPFGRVILEAREAGAPIVATSVGGIPEATDGGRCAVLVPPGNPSELADAICRLIGNESQRAVLSQRGKENLENWTVQRVAREVLGIYRRELLTR